MAAETAAVTSPGRTRREPTIPPRLAALAARVLRGYTMATRLSWPEQRRRMTRVMGAAPLPKGTIVEHDVIAGVPVTRVRVERHALADGVEPQEGPLVLHLHGGGYCIGSPLTAQGWAVALSRATGLTVVLPDYRLAPEAPFPAARDDALAVWSALTGDGGATAEQVCVSGDSAGGGLALAMTMALRDEHRPMPGSLVLLSPWLDLAADRSSDPELAAHDPLLTAPWLSAAAEAYAADVPLDDPAVSPIYGDLAGLPRMLIQAGTDDLIASDSIRLAAGVCAAGGSAVLSLANGLFHVFPLQAGTLAAANSSIRQSAAFLSRDH